MDEGLLKDLESVVSRFPWQYWLARLQFPGERRWRVPFVHRRTVNVFIQQVYYMHAKIKGW